jgi:hypothetical protein
MLGWALAGCFTAQHALPKTALSYGAAQVDEAQVHIAVRPVTAATWVDTHDPAVLMRWRERLFYTAWPTAARDDRTLYVPLVPRPSIEVQIENDSDTPLSFANARIELRDDSGASYTLAPNARAFLPDIVGPVLDASPALWLERLHWGPVADWPVARTTGPVALPDQSPVLTGLLEAAEKVPLLGPGVVVAPHSRWVGALVFITRAGSLESLADRLRGNLYVSWRGAKPGDAAAPAFEVTMPLAAAPSSGDCMTIEEHFETWNGRNEPVPTKTIIDGDAYTHLEGQEELLALHASSAEAKRAAKMRVVGNALIGAGIAASGITIGGLVSSGHIDYAPAGTAMLGISVIGGVLNYIGYRHEQSAIRQFNRYTAETGTCAAPR